MKRLKKIPTQIYLEPEQEKIQEKDPALDIIDLGDSGKGDIAERHDDYLISFKNL